MFCSIMPLSIYDYFDSIKNIIFQNNLFRIKHYFMLFQYLSLFGTKMLCSELNQILIKQNLI